MNAPSSLPSVLSPEALAKIDQAIAKYPPDRRESAVMAALTIAQDEKGWLSTETMDFVAHYLGMPPIAVYEVAKLKKSRLAAELGAGDLAEVIYVDHYGNLVTGMRAGTVPRERVLTVNGRPVPYARVFSDVRPGDVFWYENSLGLIELAANSASAQQRLGFTPGAPAVTR